ncbi:MAG: CoA transferase, partial [Afipia sp.]|nr:CoA transferase [Afipia sp.]
MFPRFLEGIRITDLTWAGAGPYSTKAFGDLGAEVLKVESAGRPDPVRNGPPYAGGVKGINRSGYFASRNNSKLSVSVDLKTAHGRELVRELAAKSDVIANNFGPSVMDKLELGYQEIRKINPTIVYLGMPMYGEKGPLAPMLGVGMTIAAVSGLTDLTGYHDGPPVGPGTHFPDHAINPYHGAFAVLSALRYRRLTGRGMKIDLAQVESTMNSVGPAFVEWATSGTPPRRIGNRSQEHAPHNIFRCKGEDAWCAVAVLTDAQWGSLCELIGLPDLAKNDKLKTAQARVARADEVEAVVTPWIAERTPTEAMQLLQRAGIPAGAVQNARDLLEDDPQLAARGYWQGLDHPEMGLTRFTSPPYLVDGERVDLKRPPLLGEHTNFVLESVLGYTPDRIAK